MKKIPLLFFTLAMLIMSVSLQAQKKSTLPISNIVEKQKIDKATGFEEMEGEFVPSKEYLMYQQYGLNVAEDVNQQNWIGFTSYDLQTNSAVKHRIHGGADGTLIGSWTHHPETTDPATTFPNRGTGINMFMNGAWDDAPNSRIESATRTGWSNVLITSTGRKVVVNHAAPGGRVVLLTQDAGQTTWTETDLPNNVGVEFLWPTAVVSGNTIHVLAITRPPDTGVIYEGLSGAVLYYRSQDGGDTWDIQDYIVPGTDSSAYVGHDIDSYSIQAKGNEVAFAIFDSWADPIVCHSTSNGDIGSWTTRKPFDFPLDKYTINDGYDTLDIGGVDPDAPNPLAIETCDGTGGIDIGPDGTIHLVFGRMYVLDEDTTDAGSSFFPGTSGLFYWNSTMPDDGASYIDVVFDAIDIDGNDTIGIAEDISFYGGGLTTMADLVVTDNGTVVISYSQHMENYVREAVPGSANFPEAQNYRHVYVTGTPDNGTSWFVPYDVINEDVLIFAGLLPETEAVYPSIYNDGGDNVHLLFYTDNEPGVFVNNAADGANDPITVNTVSHWSFDINDLDVFTVSTKSVEPQELKFKLMPNPATDQVQINYYLKENAQTTIYVSDMMGRQVLALETQNQSAGEQNRALNVEDLSPGIYLVSVQADDRIATKKLVIHQ